MRLVILRNVLYRFVAEHTRTSLSGSHESSKSISIGSDFTRHHISFDLPRIFRGDAAIPNYVDTAAYFIESYRPVTIIAARSNHQIALGTRRLPCQPLDIKDKVPPTPAMITGFISISPAVNRFTYFPSEDVKEISTFSISSGISKLL